MKHSTEDGQNAATRVLVIIGGHEDRKGAKRILREVARHVRRHGRAGSDNEACGKIVVTTVASHEPAGYFEQYQAAFGDLGVPEVIELPLASREEANDPANATRLDGADGLFFTGGDQLKITSQLGDTPVLRRIVELYESGGVIAGTSAGASALCDIMLVRGSSRESHRIGDLRMAPGLGLIRNVIIDQHFAERGRMGRLLGAVAHNPNGLGIGIDEDTAIVVENESHFRVIGSGAVYVVDGDGISYSNIADEREESPLSLHDVRLHVLSEGDDFDLTTRRPRKRVGKESASHEPVA
jgi:cyanophycinase